MNVMMAGEQADKVRENRLRRMADRQGYVLRKSRVRDPRALDYGTYWLVNQRTGGIDFGRAPGDYISFGGQSFYLDDVEAFLTGEGE